ncbi:MAG TPA: hypothetical protein VLZ50_12945 [Terracidiphilus sp.]|nr:hypothetical protein [Terracidiphilus sp.]
MRFNLGKLVLAPAVLATVALASTAAKASTVNIPFNFAAAGHVWPAGSYNVQKDLSGSFVTVKSNATALSFTSLLGPGAPDPRDKEVVLDFDQFGTSHALRTIQYGAQITSRLDRKMENSERIRASGR